VVQSAAPEILDLYQDLMPQAHAAQIDHVPALAMQFSNDCSQIADVVESMAQSSTWDPSESVLKLRELSDMAFEKQMVRAIWHSTLPIRNVECQTLLFSPLNGVAFWKT
jgi:hypothetical protein